MDVDGARIVGVGVLVGRADDEVLVAIATEIADREGPTGPGLVHDEGE